MLCILMHAARMLAALAVFTLAAAVAERERVHVLFT